MLGAARGVGEGVGPGDPGAEWDETACGGVGVFGCDLDDGPDVALALVAAALL